MSSYICQNFQLFILYNFQFYHMVLKLVLYVDFPHMRIFPYDRDFFGSVVAGNCFRGEVNKNKSLKLRVVAVIIL